jgi:RimJ/RimL family protein N-acetyltransferase
MITFERSFDYDLIWAVMTWSPAIYDKISDDYSPPREKFRPLEHDSLWYVICRDDREVLGLWIFVPQNAVCWEVHTVLLPCAWGARGIEAALELPDWIWEHTTCRRIVTHVPATNRLALRFAKEAQMVEYGVNEKSYLKDGALLDQVCLGISAPAEEWRAGITLPPEIRHHPDSAAPAQRCTNGD